MKTDQTTPIQSSKSAGGIARGLKLSMERKREIGLMAAKAKWDAYYAKHGRFKICCTCGNRPARPSARECYRCHNQRHKDDPNVKASKARSNVKYMRTSRMTLKGWATQSVVRIKRRALRNGIPFLLDRDDILRIYPLDGLCPATGVLMTLGPKSESHASVDRLVPDLGYVPSNIRILSLKANRIKDRRTAEELEEHAKTCVKIAAYIRRETTQPAAPGG